MRRRPGGPLKRLASILTIVVALALVWATRAGVVDGTVGVALDQAVDGAVAKAFAARRSDVQVAGAGVVTRILPDDHDGSRHQRFILRLADGQTVLVAHNVDLAPRVAGLERGDTVGFHGEYEYNENGGVIHWTHHDPAGRHVAGYLEHAGRKFQ